VIARQSPLTDGFVKECVVSQARGAMKLLCLTDLHGARTTLRRILDRERDADVILLGGDITNFGTPDEAERVVLRCSQAAPAVFAVAGNCDSPEIDQRLVDLDVSLFGRGRERDGVGFFGVSAMPPWHGDTYELTEDAIAAALDAGAAMLDRAAPLVMLSHPPPRDTLVDRTVRHTHVGSTAVRRAIDQTQPALVVCGHIHEARGVDQVGDTVIVNCGCGLKGLYAVAQLDKAVRVELRQA
jgi:Icc-related predicted phosphoesterase